MTDWRPLVAVAVGAAFGGVLRYLISLWTVTRFGAGTGWIATGAINVSGSFLIGIVAECALQGVVSPAMRVFLATGILGGYTTFSSYALEIALAAPGSSAAAALYAAGSVIAGVVAALAGGGLARLALGLRTVL